MLKKIPKPIRNAPEDACYVCREHDGALGTCSGGCGLWCHPACEGLPPMKGKRKRKDAEFGSCPSPATPSRASGYTFTCGRCDAIVGARVFARSDKSTFFWPARVIKRDQHDRVCVEWDEEPTAAGDSSSSSSSSTTSTDAAGSGSGSGGSSPTAGAGVDGNKPLVTATNAEDLTWVEERHVCMRDMPAEAKDLKRGSRAVAVWIDGHAYACEVLGSAGRRQMAVQFEDGLQYDAPMADMRTFLDEPLCAQTGRRRTPRPGMRSPIRTRGRPPQTLLYSRSIISPACSLPPSPVSQFQNPVFYYFLLGCCLAAAAFQYSNVPCSFNNVATIESLHGRGRLFDDASARGPSAWNNRTMSKGVWCSDSAQCGPLQRTIRRLERVWRGPRPTSGPPVGICEKGPVDGLYIVTDFLSIEEVELLRDLFSAHHGWAMYNWGNVGRRNELASVLQRIDFGLPEMTAEGVAASGSNGTQVQPIGELQQHVISLLEMRMRAHFGEVAWGGEDPTPEHRPNMLQFTRIAPGTCLGNHFDRRDKWEEGIASIAWGQAPGQEDSRGDPVRACMHACIPHTMHARALSCLCYFGSPPPFVRLFAFRLFVVCSGCSRCSAARRAPAKRRLSRRYRPAPPTFLPESRKGAPASARSARSRTICARAAGRTASGTRSLFTRGSRSRCASSTRSGVATSS